MGFKKKKALDVINITHHSTPNQRPKWEISPDFQTF